MALESVVFHQDIFKGYGCKEVYSNALHFEEENKFGDYSKLTSDYLKSSSHEICVGEVGVFGAHCPGEASARMNGRRKRRKRSRSTKNNEEMESQRMTHITVERNRRKQMNEYLAKIRSLMPPSYALRGDQATIVGGAINFVKELEQLLQYLEAQKQTINSENHNPNLFANFFIFPQYSTCPNLQDRELTNASARGTPSVVADIEVAMVESHANIKILLRKQPNQLLKLVSGIYSLGLNILHLNVTAADHMALYSLNVKVEDEAQLGTVNEVANIIHEMVRNIQQVPMSS